MPIKHKSTPGPRGESCLTCRQRRKKCDKGRPFCQRCLDSKAKFICLGYDDESEPEVERPCTRKARPRTGQVTICPPLRVGVQLEEAVPGPSTRTTYFGTPVSAAEINEYLTPSVDLFMLPGSLGKSSLTIGGSTPNHDQGAGWKHISPRRRPNNAATLPLSVSIPRGVNANKQMRESYVFFILEELNPDEPSNPHPSTQEVADKLTGLLELVAAQSIVLGTVAGYNSLRLALPSFLHLVSEDPRLLVEHERNGSLCISLPAIFISHRVELGRFMFQDVMCSIVLGLPTLAEYDSTEFPIVPGSDLTADWFHGVHGVPVEMIVNITEVHNWRARRKAADWTELEMRARAWTWNQKAIKSEESVEMVYRIAIQEAWRHATLIYIYMGMCAVTSDDPRVQASVHQIVKLMGVVGDTHLDVYFSVLAIVAGIAAQNEFQRAPILRKLKTFTGLRLWKFRGRDFARVLEHLWYGAAANGAAIGWDDYVQARCTVLPI
ncbi:unnamed protein product [Rhizoctonia solani]|uniref:Zn(2)-C6 fungal-type domain-containing protein n=1 Tax=Rhizoctonia solani TaxID=456999 RepID=A0A8H3A8K7_9AGAM|nr:unnamed protein product [Rhizoctonia solani]